MLLINDPKEALDPRQQQDTEALEVTNDTDSPEQETDADAEEDEPTDFEQDDE